MQRSCITSLPHFCAWVVNSTYWCCRPVPPLEEYGQGSWDLPPTLSHPAIRGAWSQDRSGEEESQLGGLHSGSGSIISYHCPQVWTKHNANLVVISRGHSLNAHEEAFINYRENGKCFTEVKAMAMGADHLIQVRTEPISSMCHAHPHQGTHRKILVCTGTSGWRSVSGCWWGCSQCRCRHCWHSEGQGWDAGGEYCCWLGSVGQ